MKLKNAVKILEKHQLWRRDKNVPPKYKPQNPTELGIAIDVILKKVNKRIKLKQRTSKPMKLWIEMEVEFVDDVINWNDNEEIDWLITKMLPESSIEVFNEIVGDYITKPKKIKYLLT